MGGCHLPLSVVRASHVLFQSQKNSKGPRLPHQKDRSMPKKSAQNRPGSGEFPLSLKALGWPSAEAPNLQAAPQCWDNLLEGASCPLHPWKRWFSARRSWHRSPLLSKEVILAVMVYSLQVCCRSTNPAYQCWQA